MYFEEDGAVQGFEIDIVKALANKLDLEVSINRMGFQGIIPSVDSGRCDVGLGAFYMTPERLQTLKGLSYLTAGTGLLLPVDNPKKISQIADLTGVTLAVQQGSAEDKRVQTVIDSGDAKFGIQRYQTTAAAASALNSKKVNASAITDLYAASFMEEHADEFTYLPNFFGDANPIGLVYKSDSLTSVLTEALEELDTEGTYEKILRDYNIAPENAFDISAQ